MTEKLTFTEVSLTEEELKKIADVLRAADEYELAKKFHKSEITANCSEDEDEYYGRFCVAGNEKHSVRLTMNEYNGKTDAQYEEAAIAAFKALYPEEL